MKLTASWRACAPHRLLPNLAELDRRIAFRRFFFKPMRCFPCGPATEPLWEGRISYVDSEPAMNEQKPFRPKARLPRGFKDRDEGEIAAERRMLDTIRRVYESYGFAALETSSLEYSD